MAGAGGGGAAAAAVLVALCVELAGVSGPGGAAAELMGLGPRLAACCWPGSGDTRAEPGAVGSGGGAAGAGPCCDAGVTPPLAMFTLTWSVSCLHAEGQETERA